MPSPAKSSSAAKDRAESKHGVKLPALSPPPSPKKSVEASASPVKPPLPRALPAGPMAPSASRATVSPSSPPKPDARKRPLAKLESSPAKPSAGAIAPLGQKASRPQTLPAADAPASPSDANDVTTETAALAEPTMVECAPSQAQEPPAVGGVGDATATETTEAVAATEAAADGRGDVTVRLLYQQYDELFPIAGGSTTQAAVDDVYCLSFVMPNCRLHLSRFEDAERFVRLERGEAHESVFVREQPLGTFLGLEAGHTYFVVVEQEAEQLERDQQAARELWAPEQAKHKRERDDGRGFESCSCIYGNPCVDEYGCRDWHARFAVASANGWKGF